VRDPWLVIGVVLGLGAVALLASLLMAKSRAVPDELLAFEDREQMRAVQGERSHQNERDVTVDTIH
jgi:hypothetical protein